MGQQRPQAPAPRAGGAGDEQCKPALWPAPLPVQGQWVSAKSRLRRGGLGPRHRGRCRSPPDRVIEAAAGDSVRPASRPGSAAAAIRPRCAPGTAPRWPLQAPAPPGPSRPGRPPVARRGRVGPAGRPGASSPSRRASWVPRGPAEHDVKLALDREPHLAGLLCLSTRHGTSGAAAPAPPPAYSPCPRGTGTARGTASSNRRCP